MNIIQDLHNKELCEYVNDSLSSKLDEIFVYPDSTYAKDIKQEICEKTIQFIEQRHSNCTIIDTQVHPIYDCVNETFNLNRQEVPLLQVGDELANSKTKLRYIYK